MQASASDVATLHAAEAVGPGGMPQVESRYGCALAANGAGANRALPLYMPVYQDQRLASTAARKSCVLRAWLPLSLRNRG